MVAPRGYERAPIGWIVTLGRMSGEENQRMRSPPMSQGNLRARRSPQSSRDARNNFKLDVRFTQGSSFFADASKDKRIAALKPHYLQTGCSQSDHEKVDLFLANVLFSAALANVADMRVCRGEVENLRADEIVMQYDIRLLQYPSRLESE